jgi:hypothetical protein
MDLHSRDSLLNGCLTSKSCWLSVLPLGVGVFLIVWWTPFTGPHEGSTFLESALHGMRSVV